MGVTLYRGSRGNGKTLSMTKDGLKYQALGWEIMTNLENTPFKVITSDFILSLSNKSTLFNVALLIDEIEVFFDSREWSKSDTKGFSKFIQQVRKRKVIILCTCQFTDLIDKRLRQQIDILVKCSYNSITMICKCFYYDVTSLEDNPNKVLYFSISYYSPPIFSLYNTNQLID